MSRYLWKHAPATLKTNDCSDLGSLWAVAKLLLTSDAANALALLLEKAGACSWRSLAGEIQTALVGAVRERQWSNLITSYDVITLSSAASMLQLSTAECREGQ